MAFMQKQVDHFSAWQVETNCGTECVPCDVCDDLNSIGQYCEGKPMYGDDDSIVAERVTGWFCRLSAPGYMDCTEWSGPYETEKEAMEALDEMYGDDEESEDDAA